jgi:signal peptide peptidase SppA
LSKAFRTAVNTPDVGTIVFDIDSPGGSTSGIAEVAEEIFKARGQKKMIAVSNTLMASAAYWIGSAADEIVVSPSSATGSIGVYTVHVDFSKQNEMLGVNPTYITAGKYKAETNEDQPLSSEAEAYLQSIVDDYYSLFAGAVAKHRSVNKSDVANGFGQGRVVTAKKAVELGMADRVATLSQVLEKLGVGLQTNGRNLAVERKRIALA